MTRALFIFLCLVLAVGQACAVTLVDIPMDKQINVGLGNAISYCTSFKSDVDGGYCETVMTTSNGAGGWYTGPVVDLVKAGYGPYVNMSSGTMIQYTARYYQGGGNTNPYGDAPIFVRLTDNMGRTASLDISYGASPNPTYPAWITCTDDMTTNDTGFDFSKVTKVTFYGTDWAGKGTDFIDIKNLKIIAHRPVAIGYAKSRPENETLEISGIVSAVYNSAGQFYVQDTKKIAGIQVRSATIPDLGTNVYVTGAIKTDTATGEMYINADSWQQVSRGNLNAIALNSRALGGAASGRQCGVVDGQGTSNVGLLVKLAGQAAGLSGNYLYVSDGSGVSEGGGYQGVRVDMSTVPSYLFPTVSTGEPVVITGISSLYKAADGKVYRMIRLRNRGDYLSLKPSGEPTKTLKVFVVNLDPYCPSYGNRRTHEVFGWNDPHKLANGYINDLLNASGRWCQYKIVDWYDADYHLYFEDGFRYDGDAYVGAWNNRGATPMHSGTADYYRMITDPTYPHNQPLTIAQRIASGDIDEVFMFGAPSGSAMWEASMSGTSPYFINGGTYTIPSAGRNFAVMGFNYERGVGEMLEDFCHRTECVMSRVYGPPQWWFPTWPITNNWDRFRMYDKIQSGEAACGICHYAPSSLSDYDWGNTTYVWSTCDDWIYNWPNLKGSVTKRLVNCSEWGNGDIRLHHVWWLNHLPKAPGINPDDKQNNWWKYTCDFNNYPESR